MGEPRRLSERIELSAYPGMPEYFPYKLFALYILDSEDPVKSEDSNRPGNGGTPRCTLPAGANSGVAGVGSYLQGGKRCETGGYALVDRRYISGDERKLDLSPLPDCVLISL